MIFHRQNDWLRNQHINRCCKYVFAAALLSFSGIMLRWHEHIVFFLYCAIQFIEKYSFCLLSRYWFQLRFSCRDYLMLTKEGFFLSLPVLGLVNCSCIITYINKTSSWWNKVATLRAPPGSALCLQPPTGTQLPNEPRGCAPLNATRTLNLPLPPAISRPPTPTARCALPPDKPECQACQRRWWLRLHNRSIVAVQSGRLHFGPFSGGKPFIVFPLRASTVVYLQPSNRTHSHTL